MVTMRKDDSATPNGGVRSECYFLDADGNETDEAVASQARIIEFDAEDKPIFFTYMEMNGED